MLNARELRIGNLVNPKVKEIILTDEIVSVDPSILMVILGEVNNKGIVFEPIQLTEEWLIKFGFTKYEWMDGCFIKTSFGDLMIQFFRDEIHLFFTKVSVDSKGMMFDGRRFAGDKKTFTKIQYVHQLQNLYFALTGEELTITEKMV